MLLQDSGYKKIYFLIIISFVLTFIVFSIITFFLIKQNILEETTAVMNQAKVMQQQKSEIRDIELVLSESPHLTVDRFFGRLDPSALTVENASANTGLFANPHSPIIMPLSENSFLIISPNLEAEIAQNLKFFFIVLMLFVFTLGFLLMAIHFGIKEQLKPLRALSSAFKTTVHRDKLQIDDSITLPMSGMSEIQSVFDEFNHLRDALIKKEKALIEADKQLSMLQEQERSYLAQELHDNVGQLLTSAKAYTHILTNSDDITSIKENGMKIKQLCQQISTAIRDLTTHLHPLTLDKVSLESALLRLINEQRQCLPDVVWKTDLKLNDYPAEFERDTHVYRIIQEALNNLVKYANPKNVVFSAMFNQQRLYVLIRDDGIGFENNTKEGLGLTSMRKRANCINANLLIESSLDKGTELSLELYLSSEYAKQ